MSSAEQLYEENQIDIPSNIDIIIQWYYPIKIEDKITQK
jgi:hypothetical protein